MASQATRLRCYLHWESNQWTDNKVIFEVKTLSPKPVTRRWTSANATERTLNLTKIVNSLLFCRSHFSRYSSITKFFTKELDFLIQSSFWGKISLREKSLMQFLALRCFGLLVIQENAFSYFCFRHSRREISRDIFCGPWNLGNLRLANRAAKP